MWFRRPDKYEPIDVGDGSPPCTCRCVRCICPDRRDYYRQHYQQQSRERLAREQAEYEDTSWIVAP